MSKARMIFRQLAVIAGLVVAMYFAFLSESDGAMRLVKFYVWAMAVAILIVSVAPIEPDDAKKDPRWPAALRAAMNLIDITLLLLLIWAGHMVTAVAMALAIFAGAVYQERVKKAAE